MLTVSELGTAMAEVIDTSDNAVKKYSFMMESGFGGQGTCNAKENGVF
jgi:hypothetical protein